MPNSAPDRRLISWPLLVATVSGLWLLLGTSHELLQDPDTLMHLKLGAWMAQHLQIPHSDVFSHTRAGAPWVAHEWLAAALMWAVFKLGGWTALMCATVSVYALTLAGLCRYLLQRLPPIYTLLLVALSAAPLSAHLLARPHVLAWPLLLVWTAGLVRARLAQRSPKYALVGLMVVWANLHGSFTLGLVLAGAMALEAWVEALTDGQEAGRRVAWAWAKFCALTLAAAMLTPYGWHGLGLTLHLQGLTHLHQIAEWAAPTGIGLMPVLLWTVLLATLALTGLLRLPLVRWALLAALLYQAYTASRMSSMLGLIAPVLLAAPLAQGLLRLKPQSHQDHRLDAVFDAFAHPAMRSSQLAAGVLLLMIALLVHSQGRYLPPVPQHMAQAIQALHRAYPQGPPGHVFNDYDLGAALIDQNVPVFVDGRADVYGNTVLKDYFETVRSADEAHIQHVFCRYKVGWTVLVPGTPLANHIHRHLDWQLIYRDEMLQVHAQTRTTCPDTDQ